jgi:hypothetical protein
MKKEPKPKALPIEEQNCANCAFLRSMVIDEVTYTKCHRNPPQVDAAGRAGFSGKELSGSYDLAEGIWPIITTPETKWCGEWATK